MRYLLILLLLPLTAFGRGEMPLHTGDCQQRYVERTVVKWVAV